MLERAKQMQEQLVAWRRDFHQHPELGFQEIRTAGKVAGILEGLGYRVRRGVGRTGVVAETGNGKPVIALRADMDALPLEEASGAEYASCHPGVMHACGHDAHTAMALGAAHLLVSEPLTGTVRFLFQPSEEANDSEGLSGAPRMIHDGAMEGVDLVIAQHVDPATPVGDIRLGAGAASGGVDSFFGRILGKGGHGAKPYEAVDPFDIVAHVILALNAIPSRRLHPFDPAVVSLGSIHGGQAENVIPGHVDIGGTLRYTEHRVQEQIHAEIQRAFEIARVLGGDYELRFELGDPPMYNHPLAVDLLHAAASSLLGEGHVLEPRNELGAEDFGCFSELAPGAMFVLGARIEGDERHGHNPRFDIDEGCLPIGAAIFAEAVRRYLSPMPSISNEAPKD